MRITCYLMVIVGIFFCSFKGFSKEIIKRDILVFWSSTETRGKDYSYTATHRNFESIWNFYGYRLHYLEVNFEKDRISQFLKNNKVAGVITYYFDNPVKDISQYLNTLTNIIDKKIPLIVLGEWGFLNDEGIKKRLEVDSFFKILGIRYLYSNLDNPLLYKILNKDPIVEYERKLENEVIDVKLFTSISEKNKSLLSLAINGVEKQIDLVIQGERFFYAQRGYEVFINPISQHVQWRVNPFHIVENIVGVPAIIPDITTVCGRRLAFFHIDGDGLINQSQVNRSKINGEIIFEEIISKYNYPTTVSYVVAEIDEKIFGNKNVTRVAKEISRSPFVELASHTYSHPLSWEMSPPRDEIEAYVDDKEIGKHKGPIVAYKISGYTMDYVQEIKGSTEFIRQNIGPPNKEVKLVQWSGSCRPPAIALKIAENENLLNLNGGDSRFDSSYPSISGLSALYRKVGGFTQVYSAAANENIYTNLWRGPFGGFKRVIENFENTENPKRIKPINVYYHFYSGEKESSLDSLKEVYNWVKNQKINPVFASDYVQMVSDFEKVEIEKINSNEFKVNTNGKLRTLKIANTNLFPDYEKSLNIIGHNHIKNDLYISIGSENETFISLTKKKPQKVYIDNCNSLIDGVKFEKDSLLINAGNAYVGHEIELSNGKKVIGPRGRLDSKRITLDPL